MKKYILILLTNYHIRMMKKYDKKFNLHAEKFDMIADKLSQKLIEKTC